MQQALDDNTQEALRQEHIITDSEVAFQIGDRYIAENILTKDRRQIHVPNRIFEGSNGRRVLKG